VLNAVSGQDRIVRLPRDLVWRFCSIERQINELSQRLQRQPTQDEILKHVKIDGHRSPQNVRQAMSRSTISLDALRADSGDPEATLHNIAPSDSLSPAQALIAREELEAAMASVREVESGIDKMRGRDESKLIFFRHYGLHGHDQRTYKELGAELGVTKQAMENRVKTVWRKLDRCSIREPETLESARTSIADLAEILHEPVPA
jgi:RNA polymerase primary sigma factor